ncbi:hypothetical protein SMC26_18710 [Actinomadura fulvescens]|uniref:hypothetical protein n=1 Tax=Actinomadura fulvescens TaxID=46160 RepID=UPI0031DEA08C
MNKRQPVVNIDVSGCGAGPADVQVTVRRPRRMEGLPRETAMWSTASRALMPAPTSVAEAAPVQSP